MAGSPALAKELTLVHVLQKHFVHFPHCSDDECNGSNHVAPKYCKDIFLSFRSPNGAIFHGWFNTSYKNLVQELMITLKALAREVVPCPLLAVIPSFEESKFFPVLESIPAFVEPLMCSCLVPNACIFEHLQGLPDEDDKRFLREKIIKQPAKPRLLQLPTRPRLMDIPNFEPPQLMHIPTDFAPPPGLSLSKLRDPFFPALSKDILQGSRRFVAALVSIIEVGDHIDEVASFLSAAMDLCDAAVFVHPPTMYALNLNLINSQLPSDKLQRCTIVHVMRKSDERQLLQRHESSWLLDLEYAFSLVSSQASACHTFGPDAIHATHCIGAVVSFRHESVLPNSQSPPLSVVPIDFTRETPPILEPLPAVNEAEFEAPPVPTCRNKVPLPDRRDFLPANPILPRPYSPVKVNWRDLDDAEELPRRWKEPVLDEHERVEVPELQKVNVFTGNCVNLAPLYPFQEAQLEAPPQYKPDMAELDRLFPIPESSTGELNFGSQFQPPEYSGDDFVPSRWRPNRSIYTFDRLIGHDSVGERPLFIFDVSGSMSGIRLHHLIEALLHLFREGGQIHRRTTHFGIFISANCTVLAFPFGLMKAVGAKLSATDKISLEQVQTWICSWSAAGYSNLYDAINLALKIKDATELYVFADQAPTRAPAILENIKIFANTVGKPVNAIAYECDKSGLRFLTQIAVLTGGFHRKFAMHFKECPKNERHASLVHAKNVSQQDNKFLVYDAECKCVDIALTSDSDDYICEFLSADEICDLISARDHVNEVKYSNLCRRQTFKNDVASAKQQFDMSRQILLNEVEEKHRRFVDAVEEERSKFTAGKAAAFNRQFTDPAIARNEIRIVRASLEYFMLNCISQKSDENLSKENVFQQNTRILTTEVQKTCLANHDITICPFCSRAHVSTKAKTDIPENDLDRYWAPTLEVPLIFKDMRLKDFTDDFQRSLKSAICNIISARRKTLKEEEFSVENRGPVIDAGITPTDILFEKVKEDTPSIYAQKALGSLPTLEVPVSVYVDRSVGTECVKRLSDGIEWGTLRKQMKADGFEVKLIYENRPKLNDKGRKDRLDKISTLLEDVQAYKSAWDNFTTRFQQECKFPDKEQIEIESTHSRLEAAAERENVRRLEKKRLQALREHAFQLERVRRLNNSKLRKLQKRMEKEQKREQQEQIEKILTEFEARKQEAELEYQAAFARCVKHNTEAEKDIAKLKRYEYERNYWILSMQQKRAAAEQALLPEKLLVQKRNEQKGDAWRAKLESLKRRSKECLELAQQLLHSYNEPTAEKNQLQTQEAKDYFDAYWLQKNQDNEQKLHSCHSQWEARKRDIEHNNAKLLTKFNDDTAVAIAHNAASEKKFQDHINSIERQNEARVGDARSRWQREANAVSRKNAALISRWQQRHADVVLQIERKNGNILNEARKAYEGFFLEKLDYNNKIQIKAQYGSIALAEMQKARKFVNVLLKYCDPDDTRWEKPEREFVLTNSSAVSKATARFSWWSNAGWTEKNAAIHLILESHNEMNSIEWSHSEKQAPVNSQSPNLVKRRFILGAKGSRGRSLRWSSMSDFTSTAMMDTTEIPPQPQHLGRSKDLHAAMFNQHSVLRPQSSPGSNQRTSLPMTNAAMATMNAQSFRFAPKPPAFGSSLPRNSLWNVAAGSRLIRGSSSAIPTLLDRVATGAYADEMHALRRAASKSNRSSDAMPQTDPKDSVASPRSSESAGKFAIEQQMIPTIVVFEALMAAHDLPIPEPLPRRSKISSRRPSCVASQAGPLAVEQLGDHVMEL